MSGLSRLHDPERMPQHPASVKPAVRLAVLWGACALTMLLAGCPAASADGTGAPARSSPEAAGEIDLASLGWVWPAEGFRISRGYVAPAHEYGAGHRGVDLDLLGNPVVRAPADGVVAFAGSVAGRGILTIDHGDGLVTTLEPVQTLLAPGAPVRRGQDLATLALGGHAEPGALHFGVRLHGEYINPMLLLGDIARAVLLPCCD
jgi:murein DD-endopeptidase MepM/ murein hydrolase activator NlpD